MGLEARTTARQGRRTFEGRLHLDSNHLEFKGDGLRLKLPLKGDISAHAQSGDLIVEHDGRSTRFPVGNKADKWVEKILHPPSRVKKLGIKSNQRCWISLGFSREFLNEIKNEGAIRSRKLGTCDLAFLLVNDREQLADLGNIADQLSPGVNLWIVWPKGSEAISQGDVIGEAKTHGMGPGKTAAFDAALSSMRFSKKLKR